MTKSRADKEAVILSQFHQAAMSPGFNICLIALLVCIAAAAKESFVFKESCVFEGSHLIQKSLYRQVSCSAS